MKDRQYYESLDKRTKEYRDWVKQRKSEGLGDTIEKITVTTGIDKAVKWLFGEDCGCEQRQKDLNKILPYDYKVKCLKEEEHNFLTGIKKELYKNVPSFRYPDRVRLVNIHNRIFPLSMREPEQSACSKCLERVRQRLIKVYNEYEN